MKIINKVRSVGLITLCMTSIAAHSISDITLVGNSDQECRLTATYYNGDDGTTTEAVCSFEKISGGDDRYTCAVDTGDFNNDVSRLSIKVLDDKAEACKDNGGVDIYEIETSGGLLSRWNNLGNTGTCTSTYFSNKSNGEWGTFSMFKPTKGTEEEAIVNENKYGSTPRYITYEYFEGMNSVSFYTSGVTADLISCTVWNSWAQKERFNSNLVAKGFKFESKKFPDQYLQHNTYSEEPASLDGKGNTWWIGTVDGVCPKQDSIVYLAKSEDNDNEWSDGKHGQYLRIDDDETTTTNVDQDYVGSLEEWKLKIIKQDEWEYDDCLRDGHEIRLVNVKTGLSMNATSETEIAIDESSDHAGWDRVRFYAHESDYTPETYSEVLRMSTVGGQGGTWFDDKDIANDAKDGSTRVTKIQLNTGNRVDTIGFTYSDGTMAIHGRDDGTDTFFTFDMKWDQTYHLAEGEYVKYARACVGKKNGSDRVFYLRLMTSFGNYIEGGTETEDCTQFKESVAGDGSVLISMRGRSGTEIDQIGFRQLIP